MITIQKHDILPSEWEKVLLWASQPSMEQFRRVIASRQLEADAEFLRHKRTGNEATAAQFAKTAEKYSHALEAIKEIMATNEPRVVVPALSLDP